MNFLANFTVQQREEIKADFVINAVSAGATWGSINGDINNQTDLMDILNAKADKSITINGHSLASNITLKVSDLQNDKNYQTLLQVNSLISVHNTSNTSHADIRGLIDTINTTLSGYGNIVTHNASEFATAAQGTLADTALQPTDVVNNVMSTATDLPLSANMGKEMQDEIDNLKARGRFLALWNCAIGLAASNPPESPYEYKAGDYFIVGTIGETNYRPTGSQYVTGVASTVVETEAVNVDDVYYYDGTVWRLQLNTRKEITFAQIAGQPTDNSNLASALGDKVDKNSAITAGTATKITYDSKGLVTAGTTLSASDIPSLTLSKISDVTATASELNVLDGITASTTELNYTDGVTSNIQTQLNAKANDNAVVHLTGNETIAGTKTFSSNIVGNLTGNADTSTTALNSHSLQAYANKGEVLTDSEGLSAIKEYNRSTFDISKFTKAGSPTVTNDGIITFGDSSNYMQADFDFTQNHVFEIEFSGNNSTATTYRPINNGYQIYINPNNAGRMLLYAQSGNAGFLTTISNTALSSNYTIKLKITKNNLTYTIDYLINGTTSGTETVTLQSTPAAESNIRFYALDTQHSVNLKSVSITANGQEVFNGNKSGQDVIDDNITIPYNYSKTGLKIVQAYYRDKVQSMYSQYGWANYFTLSNTDFTLPMGENLDGHVAKVDWYKNGITTWEYDTNLDCIETGSCTSGTAVTLPKPMADDTYSLSVPYSAKSKTGFTPTATGDYIAKGKVVLG